MKKAFAIISFLLFASALTLNNNWQPIPKARVNFTIDGVFGKDVHGTIGDLKTDINFHPDDLSHSSITATISPKTVNTGIKRRDAHLRTADFFDVEKFPQISFTSKSFRQVGEYFVAEGELSMKDVKKQITIPFEFTVHGDSAVFNGDFNINRLDYHVGKKSRLVGNEVRVHLNIPVKAIH